MKVTKVTDIESEVGMLVYAADDIWLKNYERLWKRVNLMRTCTAMPHTAFFFFFFNRNMRTKKKTIFFLVSSFFFFCFEGRNGGMADQDLMKCKTTGKDNANATDSEYVQYMNTII